MVSGRLHSKQIVPVLTQPNIWFMVETKVQIVSLFHPGILIFIYAFLTCLPLFQLHPSKNCALLLFASDSLFVFFHSVLWPVERGWRGVWSPAGLEISVMEKNLKLWDHADQAPAMVSVSFQKSWGKVNSSRIFITHQVFFSNICLRINHIDVPFLTTNVLFKPFREPLFFIQF